MVSINYTKYTIAKKIFFLCFTSLFYAAITFAAVNRGNVSLYSFNADSAANSFTFFNLSNMDGASGHIKFLSYSTLPSANYLEGMNGVKFLFFGLRTASEFATITHVPNATFHGFGTAAYESTTGGLAEVGNQYPTYAVMIPTSSNGTFYALIFITNGTNPVRFNYTFNTAANNNTFGTVSPCSTYSDFSSCIADAANSCTWKNERGICEGAQIGSNNDLPPADCSMLPQLACNSINNTFCSWSPTEGRAGLCRPGQNYNPFFGFACTAIINNTFCNNQPFTQKTGLCSWSNSICSRNSTKTISNIPRPPVSMCDAPGYVNNRTACAILSDTYYLPCGFDNSTNKCSSLFFDAGRNRDFGSISDQQTCESQGGTWRTETTYDPLNNQVTSENWCEFGTAVRPFSAVGGGQSSGSGGQLQDCSTECSACMYNSTGGRWPNASVAQSQCSSSAAGCTFRADTNAMNGFGWCNPAREMGGFNCATTCGDCNMQPDRQTACTNSPALCRWDNVTSTCAGGGVKSCTQDCMQCSTNSACGSSTASGGCQWDSTMLMCKPRGGAFEICYDGIDNDNNQRTDCADAKCAFDQFCAGGAGDQNKCSRFDIFRYGAAAQANCTATTGCTWTSDQFSFSYCAPLSDQCFNNQTLQSSRSVCETFGDGNICKYRSTNFCSMNATMMNNCFNRNTTTCSTAAGCRWNTDSSICDFMPVIACEKNQTLQQSQSECDTAGCAWIGNRSLGIFEGQFTQKCVSPCGKQSITTAAACANVVTGTGFVAGSCSWQVGMCEPNNFVGGCMDNEGDITACRRNENCAWVNAPFGPMRALNGSSNKQDFAHSNAPWIAIGLDLPVGGNNESTYILNKSNGVAIKMAMGNFYATTEQKNVSRLICGNTDIMKYNWSSGICQTGTCNDYNVSTCNNSAVHYYLNLTNKQLEVVWEVTVPNLILDSTEANAFVTDVSNATTVTIDGNLSEHIAENATARDGTKAHRVRTAFGFCSDKLQNSMFGGMEDNPPTMIATDASGGSSEPSDAYLDITRLGVKKTPTGYVYGITVRDIAGSVLCKNVPLRGNGFGTATNTSRYYLYLDTNGNSGDGCTSDNSRAVTGFEYLFKYVASADSGGQLSESLLSVRCSSNTWVATSIPFKIDKNKACSVIGGPIFAIDKDTLTGKSDVNTEIGWRAYATSANSSGNSSTILDSVGPGTGDFRGIDFKPLDCTRTDDKDNSQCTKFKQFGFFPGEFGPACIDSIDNDGDGSTDCDDNDCKPDQFFCAGSFRVDATDTTAPSLVWAKINEKIPTSLTFIFDTNEPSEGLVNFYLNDTQCSTLNRTAYDKALEDTNTFNNYRTHHIATADGLRANTTYFFKYSVCDVSSNCAVSACTNATTAATHSNITFKIALPENWTLDMPSINLTNFSGQYALKASTEFLHDINLTINASDHRSSITFVGMTIFEKQTLNLSGFVVGAGFIGFDSNQYQSLKQKTGIEKIIIIIPTTGDKLLHCDDNGENCRDVSSSVDCTFASDRTVCTITDAVGLGFSSYKATSTASTTTSPGSSLGGGATGGGISQKAVTSSTEKTWVTTNAGTEALMNIVNDNIAIRKIVIPIKKNLEYFKVVVKSLAAKPDKTKQFDGTPYQYLSIQKENAKDSDIGSASISFVVKSSWTKENNVEPATIALYRYHNDVWNKLATSYKGLTNNIHEYEASASGFSFFVIGTEKASVEKPAPPAETQQKEEPKQEDKEGEKTISNLGSIDVSKQESVAGDETVAGGNKFILWVFIALVIIGVVYYMMHRKR